MSDNERTWYYADKPSPLHEARDVVNAKLAEVAAAIEKLQEELGADQTVERGGHISGFTFPGNKSPPNWKVVSGHEGRPVFMPKKVGRENIALTKIINGHVIPSAQRIASTCNLFRMTCDGRYMYRTVVGWRDNRIFIGIPKIGDGDPMPEIPEWLTECPAWAKDKFLETGEA